MPLILLERRLIMRVCISDEIHTVVEVIPADLTVTFRLAPGSSYDRLVWHCKRTSSRRSKINELFVKGYLNLSNFDVTVNG